MLTDHTIGLLGFLVGLLGVIVGLVGVVLAVQSNRKLKTAEQAKARVERKFNEYMGAQEFKKLAIDGLLLIQDTRSANWPSVAVTAGRVSLDLLQARGARSRLLSSLERDKLDAAVTAMQSFNLSLPLAAGPPITNDQIQTMILQCQQLADLASELAGRLSVKSMSQSEEDQ